MKHKQSLISNYHILPTLLSTLLLCTPSPARVETDSLFFSSLRKYPDAVQLEKIKKRLSFMMQKKILIELPLTITKGYEKSSNKDEFYAFLEKQLTDTKNKEFIKKLSEQFISICHQINCHKYISIFLKSSNQLLASYVARYYIKILRLHHIDLHNFNGLEFDKLLLLSVKEDPKTMYYALRWANLFSREDAYNKLTKQQGIIIKKDPWVLFQNCTHKEMRKLWAEAKVCFDKKSTPWFVFMKYKVQVLQGEVEVDENYLNRLVANIEMQEKKKSFNARLTRTILLNRVSTKDIDFFREQDLLRNLEQGFIQIHLAKKFQFLHTEALNRYIEIYTKKHSKHLFADSFSNPSVLKKIKSIFSPGSPFIEVLSTTEVSK